MVPVVTPEVTLEIQGQIIFEDTGIGTDEPPIAILRIARYLPVMAAAEELEAHKNAISLRLEELKDRK